jgi:ABC-type proline/glycine betaine transport system permease subunit
VRNLRVVLGDALLVLSEVVEAALVGLSVAMLRAEDERTLAGDFHHANFLATLPAFIQVLL